MMTTERTPRPIANAWKVGPLVVGGVALAGLVPAALIGWAVMAYRHELEWLDSSSGLLDGKPDLSVLFLGATGAVLLIVLVLVTYRISSRAATSRRLAPRTAGTCSILGAMIALAGLLVALAAVVSMAPDPSTLVPPCQSGETTSVETCP